jgi:hypothetical protein
MITMGILLLSTQPSDHLDCSNDRYGLRCALFYSALSLQIIWTAPMIAMGFDVRSSTQHSAFRSFGLLQ